MRQQNNGRRRQNRGSNRRSFNNGNLNGNLNKNRHSPWSIQLDSSGQRQSNLGSTVAT